MENIEETFNEILACDIQEAMKYASDGFKKIFIGLIFVFLDIVIFIKRTPDAIGECIQIGMRLCIRKIQRMENKICLWWKSACWDVSKSMWTISWSAVRLADRKS